MDAGLSPLLPGTAPDRHHQMMAKAEELEATFLAEMLGHAGLGNAGMDGGSSGFDGGHGEEQFTSFLKQEQARIIVEKGGIGLAQLIFNSMVQAEHGSGN
jgi:peptidoglycan hydrolase FlgJ